MRRLSTRLAPRRDERGVTVVLVSVFAVVAVAMAALAIDIGALVYEKRELRNGADSVALSVAHTCAKDESAAGCTDYLEPSKPVPADLKALANSNAVDRTSTVWSVRVDKTANTVTVETRTRTGSGGSLLPFSFGQAASGESGKTVRATSVAAWGNPAGLRTIPLTFSMCEWEGVELNVEVTTIFHTDSKSSSSCKGPAGKDAPGGFGWLDPVDGECAANITSGTEASANTGTSALQDCDLDSLMGEPLLVPVFDSVTGTGTNAKYQIAGFAAFTMSGYRFPSASGGTPVPCKAPNTCIRGVFTEFIQNSGGPIGGGSNFGVVIIKLVS